MLVGGYEIAFVPADAEGAAGDEEARSAELRLRRSASAPPPMINHRSEQSIGMMGWTTADVGAAIFVAAGGKVGVQYISKAASDWIKAKAGRKVKVKTKDYSFEVSSLEEAERLIPLFNEQKAKAKRDKREKGE